MSHSSVSQNSKFHGVPKPLLAVACEKVGMSHLKNGSKEGHKSR